MEEELCTHKTPLWEKCESCELEAWLDSVEAEDRGLEEEYAPKY